MNAVEIAKEIMRRTDNAECALDSAKILAEKFLEAVEVIKFCDFQIKTLEVIGGMQGEIPTKARDFLASIKDDK